MVVEDEQAVLNMLSTLLRSDYDLVTCSSAERGQESFLQKPTEIILADQELPGMSGLAFLDWVRRESPRTVRILMTGLKNLDQAVEAINSGLAQRFVFKPFRPEQILPILRSAARSFLLERSHEQLLDELRRLNQELEERVTERTHDLEAANRQLAQRNQMLQRMALTDPLTGLPNRRAMDRLAKNELLRRARSPASLTIGLVDADHFKTINTRFLLPGGDHVLSWLGSSLVNAVRTIDTVGRVGGEEFMIVAPDTNVEGATILGERVRKTIESSQTVYHGEMIKITVSIGMVVAEPNVLVGYDQMRHAAAAAMSEAKLGGRNRSVVRQVSSFAGPASS
jgi:diguanylate cyclase (GGDEF)-like protein